MPLPERIRIGLWYYAVKEVDNPDLMSMVRAL
jgi:hypothetical protein